MSNQPWEQDDAGVALDARTEVRRPPLFKVYLHNDDFTSMEFVVFVLKTIYHHEDASAFQIMMHVHQRGIGVAGLFPYETAEAKVDQTHGLAREYDFPLMCSIEPE
jgi:ATP-dependent Clp protease adaptor protein ClpS